VTPLLFNLRQFSATGCKYLPAAKSLAIALSLLAAALMQAPPTGAQAGLLPGLTKPASAPAAAPPAPASPQPPSQAPNLAIPLPQIADQAEELDQTLADISKDLASKTDEIAPGLAAANQSAEVRERSLQVDRFLDGAPDILSLREEVVYWSGLSERAAAQRKRLTTRADELQNQLSQLDQEQARWQATRDQIHDTEGIQVVAARVQHELGAIRSIRGQAQDQLNQVLTLQNQLSETGRQISDSLAKLVEAEDRFRVRVLDRDSQPLWSSNAFRNSSQPAEMRLGRSAHQELVSVGEFLRTRAIGLLFIPVLYLFAVLAAIKLKNYMASRTWPGVLPEAHQVFARPFAVALMITLTLTISETPSAPVTLVLIAYLLWMGVLFRLGPLVIPAGTRSLFYLLLTFCLIMIARGGVPLPPGLRRITLPILILGALIAFGWATRPSKLSQMGLSKWAHILLRTGIRLGLFLMAMGLLVNICGFVSLSRVLGVGTLLSAFFAAGIYCVVRIFLLALSILLESPLASSLSADLRRTIALWTQRVLAVVAVLLWWTRSERNILMLQDSVLANISKWLTYPITLGKAQFSIGGIITVLLILGVGYGLAKGASNLLKNILVAKLPFQRGLPYAVSKVTYYCLMLLVFTAAVTSAGVELNKFTVITGAIGVGVGFGLQNIINNFASGLILLFERPVRVGDTVEVNNLVGTVRRIGARSSTIGTFQGAEVIVPNSNLISNQVINWTLSSPWRRVEIPVGVAYGSDPGMVLQLLTRVANEHPDVMRSPAPEAFFLGFGDSALNFELRFWAAGQDTWFRLKSDVTIGMNRALNEAGIEIPFPQRDLHLRGMDLSVANQGGLISQALNGAKASSVDAPKEAATAPDVKRSPKSPPFEEHGSLRPLVGDPESN